jgi:uncharacterized protein (DUF58 family)
VLSAEETRLLDGLTVGAATATAAASAAGLRRARTRGAGVEFHEYRHYQPGDDPRSIDWTVEARLQQLVVRVSRAEGDLRLHVLVDISGSMSLGVPEKRACAAKLAAALSYVAIERRDAAGLATFDDRVHTFLAPTPGRLQLFRILDALRSASPNGPSSINNALLHYGAAVRGPGLVVVISDFFEPGGGLEGLLYLLHRGLTPAVVQVVAREELEPALDDVTEIVDVEHPQRRLVVSAAMVDDYRQRLAQHVDALRTFCLRHRLPWVQVESSTSFKSMLALLETSGIFTATA